LFKNTGFFTTSKDFEILMKLTMDASVLILPLSHYAYAVKKFNKCDVAVNWFYLGKDFSSVCSLESELPMHFKRMQIGKFHNMVADRIRKKFVDWLDQLNDLWGTNKEWWFESVSSRNVYDSDLFQNCCYVEIIKELFSRDPSGMPCIIFVDSAGLAGVLTAWLVQKKIKVLFCRRFFAGIFIKRSLLTIHDYCFFVVRLLTRIASALLTKPYRKHKKNSSDSPQILIDTFIRSDSFWEDGSFHDSYYPGLYQFLRAKGYNILIHPVLEIYKLNLYPIYKQMSKSSYNFIIPEDHLRLIDYLDIIFYPFRFFKRAIKAMPFLEVDITPLINEERMFPAFSGPMYAVLIYRFFIRFKRMNPALKIIINWYENQAIDRAFILGAREAFPKAKLIGVQMFMHSLNHLNIFPTKTEIKYNLVPDLVLCNSQLQCELTKVFTDKFRCVPCAALRYNHVFEKFSDPGPEAMKIVVLVMLPLIPDEAFELLSVVKEASRMFVQNITIRIKKHHLFDIKSFSLKFKDLPGQLCDKGLKEELRQAFVVVGTYSSALVEALAYARPVIFMSRQNCFSHNPLVNMPDKIARVCYSSSELAEAINYYYSLPLLERSCFSSEASRIRDLYFTPVSEETLEPFLGG
jgi:hypothetical protein